MVDRYDSLQKNKNRLGKAKNNRDEFLSDLQNTFETVTKVTKDILSISTNKKNRQDWLYLNAVHGKKREATLGCMDRQVSKKVIRKRKREEQRENKSSSKINICPVEHEINVSSSSEEDIDIHDPDIEYNLKRKTPKRHKNTKKKQVVTPEVCSISLKYSDSNRKTFEMVGASTSDINPNEKVLSVNTVRRKKLKFTMEVSAKLFSEELSTPSLYYILHWDGKILKPSKHTDKNDERVAVILTSSDGDEILLGIMPVTNGTAAEEHKVILNLLVENKIPLEKIAACVFDTTSVNTGELNGIIRKLEASLNHSYLELACRHHIYELVCGAASEIVLGKNQEGKNQKKTTSPYEPLFKKLCNSWNQLNKNDIATYEETSLSRTLIRKIEEAKDFLYKWLENEKSMREDYHEMATLCLIYLGGTLPEKLSKFKFRDPSAFHHARWMAKVLYVLKLAMLKPAFVNNITKIRSLALFYSVYYAEAWLTSIFASEAPFRDLNYLKALEEASCAKGVWPDGFQALAKAALDKLKVHTWYLSERLVGLSLFSDKVDNSTKEAMRSALLKSDKKPLHTEQQRPECSSFLKKQLKDFIGPDTYVLFDLLRIDKELLSIPVSKWSSSSLYHQNMKKIKHLPVVNDAAERALGMATQMYKPTMPKNEKYLQASFKVVHAIRKIQGYQANSSERATKHNLTEFLKDNRIVNLFKSLE